MTKDAQLSIIHRDHFDRGFAGLIFAMACMILLFTFVRADYWQFFAGAVFLGLLIATVLHLLQRPEILNPPDGYSARQQYPHQGITMHQIRFGGGFAGLLFTVGCVLLFLFGTPGLWVIFPAALVLGAVIATVFHFLHP